MSDAPDEPQNTIGGATPWVTRNAPSVETIKAAIVAELLRQNDVALAASPRPEHALDHMQMWPPCWVTLDGSVDLDALAAAVASALKAGV